MRDGPPKLAVIGFGAMGRSLAGSLARGGSGLAVGATLLRAGERRPAEAGIAVFRSPAELAGWHPSLVVECAGDGAVRESVPVLLGAGVDVVAVSVGALADQSVRDALEQASASGGGRLTLVAGAVGGLDALRAARLAGLDEVSYRGTKPPTAWRGTPAETILDLEGLREPTVFFRGSAAEASSLYPKNANVTAAIALAGIGFERTGVVLAADPMATSNSHRIAARGPSGGFSITLENVPLPSNPRTSWLAALSVEQAVIRHFQTIAY